MEFPKANYNVKFPVYLIKQIFQENIPEAPIRPHILLNLRSNVHFFTSPTISTTFACLQKQE